jgi:hypothetical protein
MRIDSVRFNITPAYPVSLLGYFNERISTGVADALYCRLLALECKASRFLIVQIDNCLVSTEHAEELRRGICSQTDYAPSELLIYTTHTHTAPALVSFYGAREEQRYRSELFSRIVDMSKTLKPQTPCSVKSTAFRAEGLSHNRRWYMTDGSVVTNPPKGSKDRAKPEGPVDDEVIVIGFFDQDDTALALLVNISNHTDSVGGTEISADWPGFMERRIQEGLEIPVNTVTLIAPQGNINHYDFDTTENQTSLDEARRIGTAYGELVLSNLSACRTVDEVGLHAMLSYVDIAPRETSDEELRRAREIQQSTAATDESADLKAEDLDTPAVLHIFAAQLLAFHEQKPQSYSVPLQVMRMGSIYLCAIPGEPFVELGLDLKKSVAGATVVPVALAGGYVGYIPLEENFDRGGYEVKQGIHNCLSRKAAGIILHHLQDMMTKLNVREAG